MQISKTEDSSNTIFSEQYGEHYHSIHGAINESKHIFIQSGLQLIDKKEISIFEMGFGTGLNALLSLDFAERRQVKIQYFALEKHKIPFEIFKALKFDTDVPEDLFLKLHLTDWETTQKISTYFSIQKIEVDIRDFEHEQNYDLVFYDAFSPNVQPELWTEAIFERLYNHMNPGSLLLTYTVNGMVKRALKAVGFSIEKIPGPIGKREILRAIKPLIV